MKLNFSKYSGIIAWFIVAAFIVILPFIWADKVLLDASQLSRLLGLAIFLPILAIIILILIKYGFRFQFSRAEKVIFGGLLAFMLMHFVSSINAINYYEVVFRTAKEFIFILWFFFVYQLLIAKPNGVNILIKSIVLMGCIFMGIATYQLVSSDFSAFESANRNITYYLNQVMENVYSTCSNKNLFASILFLIFPLSVYCIYLSVKEKGWLSKVWLAISIIAVLGEVIFFTLLLTRAVMGALVIAMFLTIILLYIYILVIRPRKSGELTSKKLKLTMIIAPVVIVLALIVFVGFTETKVEQMITERIMLTFNPEKYGYRSNETGTTAISMRTLIWQKTIEMIKEHPLLGSGPGQWQILIPKYGVDEFNEALREGSLTYQRPHNDFLWYAAEVGILGLIGYLIFFIGILFIGVRNIFKTDNSKTAIFNIIAISALVGMVFIMNVDYPHERIEHNVVYLSILALVLANFKIENQNFTEEENTEIGTKKSAISTIAIMSICLIISIIGLQQSYTYYQGEHNARRVLQAHYGHNWKLVMQLTRNVRTQAYTLNNYTVPMPYYRGFAESMMDKNDLAVIDFVRALELNPYHILTLNALGTSYSILSENEKSIELYSKTLAMSPHNIYALVGVAVQYLFIKDFDNAINYIHKVDPDTKDKPENYQKICLSICRHSALKYKDLCNEAKLAEWLNDENRIMSSLAKFQKMRHVSWSEFLQLELGK